MMSTTLRFESIECEDLPSADGSRGTTDPYIVVRCGGSEGTTPYKSNAVNPRWAQQDTPFLVRSRNRGIFPPSFSLLLPTPHHHHHPLTHTVGMLPVWSTVELLPFISWITQLLMSISIIEATTYRTITDSHQRLAFPNKCTIRLIHSREKR